MVATVSAKIEWQRGWPLPVVAAVGLMLNPFHLYSLGVFLEPVEQAMGWSRTEIALGMTVASVISLAIVPVVGWMVDRFGPRRIAIPAVTLYCISVALLGTTGSSHWNWWILWGLLSFGSSATSPVIWTTAVASRFDKSRGMAMALTLCGAGLSSIMAPLLANALIQNFGWRWGYIGSGAIMLVIALPLMVGWFYGQSDLDRKRRETAEAAAPQHKTMGETAGTLKSSVFVRLALSIFILMTAMSAFLVHFVPALRSLDISASQAAGAAAFTGLGSIAGRLIGGVLLDRISAAVVGLIAFWLPAVAGLAVLYLVHDFQTACVVAFIIGLSLGCELDVMAYLTSRLFKFENFGRLFGVIIALSTLAYGVGPALGGVLFEINGNYTLMFLSAVPLFIIAGLLVLSLRRHLAIALARSAQHTLAH